MIYTLCLGTCTLIHTQHTHIHTYTHTHTDTHMHTHTQHMHIHVYTCTHIWTRTHTHNYYTYTTSTNCIPTHMRTHVHTTHTTHTTIFVNLKWILHNAKVPWHIPLFQQIEIYRQHYHTLCMCEASHCTLQMQYYCCVNSNADGGMAQPYWYISCNPTLTLTCRVHLNLKIWRNNTAG